MCGGIAPRQWHCAAAGAAPRQGPCGRASPSRRRAEVFPQLRCVGAHPSHGQSGHRFLQTRQRRRRLGRSGEVGLGLSATGVRRDDGRWQRRGRSPRTRASCECGRHRYAPPAVRGCRGALGGGLGARGEPLLPSPESRGRPGRLSRAARKAGHPSPPRPCLATRSPSTSRSAPYRPGVATRLHQRTITARARGEGHPSRALLQLFRSESTEG